jgi:hypothetical protein
MEPQGVVIDAAVRFLRSNPELLAYAQSAAAAGGMSVEALLTGTVARVRAEAGDSTLEAIAKEQVVLGAAHRQQRRSQER